MSDATSRDTPARAAVTLALAATARPVVDPCPGDHVLAQLVDGLLEPRTRETVLEHIDACPDCYAAWREAAAYMTERTISSERAAGAHATVTKLVRRARGLICSWQVVLPAGAVAAIAAALIAWPTDRSIENRLDAVYATVKHEAVRPTVDAARDLTMPWGQAVPGFSATSATPGARAYGTGLWSGRAALAGVAVQDRLAWMIPPHGGDWSDGQWAALHALGRWTALAWTMSRTGARSSDWRSVHELGVFLRDALRADGSVDAPRAKAAATLDRVLPLVSALADDDAAERHHRNHTSLDRELERAAGRLSP